MMDKMYRYGAVSRRVGDLALRRWCPGPAYLFVCLLTSYILVLNGWVSDDWFIGLRQVRNLVDAQGLVWNLGERVQTFTCPLWLFSFTPFYWITREAFVTTLVVQSILTYALFWVARKVWVKTSDFLFFSALLLLSSGLTDYFTSGTESILSLLLLAIFWGHFFNSRSFSWQAQLVCSSLLLLNRLDFILIIGPWLIYFLLKREISVRSLILVITPVSLWGLFSLIYFGLPLPTTFYSKLTHSISFSESLWQGVLYFKANTVYDPLFMAFLFSAFVLSLSGIKAPFIAPDKTSRTLLESGVADEKKFYHDRGHSLYSYWVLGAERDLSFLQYINNFLVTPIHGMKGYYSSDEFYILDPSGIGSPYMLNFPTVNSARVGHYFRRVPLELVDHLAFNKKIENNELRSYVEDIKLAIKGELWSWRRWSAIWRLNTMSAQDRLSYYWSLSHARTAVEEDIQGEGKFYLRPKD